jgi:hypothetical protein
MTKFIFYLWIMARYLTKSVFLYQKLVGRTYEVKNEYLFATAKVLDIHYCEGQPLEIDLEWQGYVLSWAQDMETNIYQQMKLDISECLGTGMMHTAEAILKPHITRITQYVNVYPDEIFFNYPV